MRRVVVTGLGALSPCGLDVSSNWAAVLAGRSGVGPITAFDASGWPVRIAGEVRGFDPSPWFPGASRKRADRFTWFAVAAADEALRDAGLAGGFADDPRAGERAGVYIGTGIGGIDEIQRTGRIVDEAGPRRVSPFFVPRVLANLAAGHVAMRWKLRGPSLCVNTACATGNHSIGEAWRAIRAGDADIVVAGGTEAGISPVGIGGFVAMRALSRRNEEPARASRPFDRDRDGFVVSEGAGVVVLEELGHARARGARIYAELVGYALTNDAHHLSAPPPGHEGAARCMALALRSAGLAPGDIDHVNAHGTSTPANDAEEVRAIEAVFGDHARRLLVSSTKGATGHLLGAAGGIEAVFSVLALHHGIVPPTANLEHPDPACGLDHVPGEARRAPLRAVLSNAFGFGGTNACLVFRRWADSEEA